LFVLHLKHVRQWTEEEDTEDSFLSLIPGNVVISGKEMQIRLRRTLFQRGRRVLNSDNRCFDLVSTPLLSYADASRDKDRRREELTFAAITRQVAEPKSRVR
jgi:hypothetical protein